MQPQILLFPLVSSHISFVPFVISFLDNGRGWAGPLRLFFFRAEEGPVLGLNHF